MFRERIKSIHFVGIGGIGMSGIAEVLLSHGFAISGSDLTESDITKRLTSLGARIHVGHSADNVQDADVLVYSSAVKKDNPEIVEARSRMIPVIPRAEMLAELMRLKNGLAVAGSHGKTTTTSLIATILRLADLDPTVIIGGKLNVLGSSARHGRGDLLVAEADESDGSFLLLHPVISIITNIDPEHLDYYDNLDAIKDAFVAFANRVPFYGLVIACLDDPNVQDLLPRIEKRTLTYGTTIKADYCAHHIQLTGLSSHFQLDRKGQKTQDYEVRMPGEHSVLNALAAIAVADELGVDPNLVKQALSTFDGVQRRFTVLGEVDQVTVVDDYGHHPSEIKVTLKAAKQVFGRRLVVAFQPHRYTRTHFLYDQLTGAFERADLLLITDVYAAGEQPIEGANSSNLAQAIRKLGQQEVHYVANLSDMKDMILTKVAPGDVVITLGAGNITRIGPELLQALHERATEDGRQK